MWRFLLAGLITGGGLVVLFIASFGDPATTSRNLHSAFAVAQRPVRQLAAESTAMIEAPAAASHSDEAVPATAPRPPTSYDGVAEPSSEAITAPPGGPARGAAAEAAGVAMQAASIQPAPQTVTPPIYREPFAHAPPWQTARAPVQRIRSQSLNPSPARIIADFRRDLRALFRSFAR